MPFKFEIVDTSIQALAWGFLYNFCIIHKTMEVQVVYGQCQRCDVLTPQDGRPLCGDCQPS